jgi:hypothetical protein
VRLPDTGLCLQRQVCQASPNADINRTEEMGHEVFIAQPDLSMGQRDVVHAVKELIEIVLVLTLSCALAPPSTCSMLLIP